MSAKEFKKCGFKLFQEKMRGQRGRLPVQALGYVNSTKVILGLPETAGVHFLLRPHHYILKVITQFRNGSPRANTSMEASSTGILESLSLIMFCHGDVYTTEIKLQN